MAASGKTHIVADLILRLPHFTLGTASDSETECVCDAETEVSRNRRPHRHPDILRAEEQGWLLIHSDAVVCKPGRVHCIRADNQGIANDSRVLLILVADRICGKYVVTIGGHRHALERRHITPE